MIKNRILKFHELSPVSAIICLALVFLHSFNAAEAKDASSKEDIGSSSKNMISANNVANDVANKVADKNFRNPAFWPPLAMQFFPEMELVNQDGRQTKLSDFRGKIIIVQYAAMGCPVSQGYAGATRPGYRNLGPYIPPPKIKFFPDLMREMSGVSLGNPDVVWVQILLYNNEGKLANLEDVKKWADHFELKTSERQYVLAPVESMDMKQTRLLVPGFQLINRAFMLISDSTGPVPKDDLYGKFFPTLMSQVF